MCLTDKPLGRGSYAVVYKGTHKQTKRPVAIKVMEYDTRSDTDRKYLDQELLLHASMKHPNILELLYKVKMGSKYFVVLEFCAGGDLRGFIDMQPHKMFTEEIAKHFMCQIGLYRRPLLPASNTCSCCSAILAQFRNCSQRYQTTGNVTMVTFRLYS